MITWNPLSLLNFLCICIFTLQDRALPISGKSSSVRTRLRLCNKLTELMLSLKMYGEAVKFAQAALDISITIGMEKPKYLIFYIRFVGNSCAVY